MSDIKPRPENEIVMASPTAALDSFEDEVPETKWPTRLGVFCLVYAAGGLLCSVGVAASPFLTSAMFSMGGMEVPRNSMITLVSMVSGALGFAMGLVMLSGAINLLRRQRSGPKLLKVWVMGRLTLLVLGMASSFLLSNAYIDLQKNAIAAQNQMLAENNMELVPVPSDEEIAFSSLRSGFLVSAVLAVFPVFLGFYLSKHKVKEETQLWR